MNRLFKEGRMKKIIGMQLVLLLKLTELLLTYRKQSLNLYLVTTLSTQG